MGLKAIAIYRDGSKRIAAAQRRQEEGHAATTDRPTPWQPPPQSRRRASTEPDRTAAASPTSAPPSRTSSTSPATRATSPSASIEDGQPGEIFLKMAKEGSTISGLMDTFATTVSVALQYGVPLHDLVHKFAHVRFEPSGFTSNPEIPIAKSIIDYIFRWLGSRFLPAEDRATLGLVDRSANAESTIQPLNLGLGGPGTGIAGTPGSGSSPAAGPASPWGGDAGEAGSPASAGASTAVAGPGDVAPLRRPPESGPTRPDPSLPQATATATQLATETATASPA